VYIILCRTNVEKHAILCLLNQFMIGIKHQI